MSEHRSANNTSQSQSHSSDYDRREFISNGVKEHYSSAVDNNQGNADKNAQQTSFSTDRGRVAFSDSATNEKLSKANQTNKSGSSDDDNAQQQGSETQHKVEDQPEQGVGGLTGTQHYGKIDLKHI
ncbi:unnamed protein product [Absidia cylindrospora]